MTTKHTPSGWTDNRPLSRNKLIVALEAERDQLKASNAELVAALEDCSTRLATAFEQEPQVSKDIGITKALKKARAALAKSNSESEKP